MYFIVIGSGDRLPGIYDTYEDAVREVRDLEAVYCNECPEMVGTLSVINESGKVVY